MHGQKRNEYKMRMRDPGVAAGLAKKAQQWFQLSAMLVQSRSDDTAQQQHLETLQLLSKLVLVNPDPMYLWNHRRDLLLQLTSAWEQPAEYFNNELTLTQQCLGRNTKAYSVWFHRKWLISNHHHHHHPAAASLLLYKELDLTAQFLQLDERNFHCWNYRRFVIGLCGDSIVGSSDAGGGGGGEWTWLSLLPTTTHNSSTMGRQVGALTTTTIPNNMPNQLERTCTAERIEQLQALIDSEWNFTTTKISANFSNGSAFHYRSKLLHYRLVDVELELELIHNAIFTEPDDQTAWWYLEYLLPLLSPSQLEDEKALLQELVADHPSKWVWLGLCNVLSRMEGQEDAVLDCLGHLIDLDVDRKARYESLKPAVV